MKKGMDRAITKAMTQRKRVMLSQEMVAVRVRVLMWWGWRAKMRLKMYLEATWPNMTPAMMIYEPVVSFSTPLVERMIEVSYGCGRRGTYSRNGDSVGDFRYQYTGRRESGRFHCRSGVDVDDECDDDIQSYIARLEKSEGFGEIRRITEFGHEAKESYVATWIWR